MDEGEIDYLTEVPLDALTAYIDGRSAYRRTAYIEARTAHMKALDIDSTFALAAVGAYQAIQMGLDAERFTLRDRALRLLRNHIDNLPPRDEEFVRLWLPPNARYSLVERVRTLGELVNRFPESPEAWYEYGDVMFHNIWRVSREDWLERSKEAFEKALELDPSMGVARQHLDYHLAESPDTVGVRDMLDNTIRIAAGSETEVWARAGMASLGDSASLAWINDNLEQLPYTLAQMLLLYEGYMQGGFKFPSPYGDRIFARLERTALTQADRRQYLTFLHGYYRSGGRSDEADDVLRDFEAEFYPVPTFWIQANLYWDGAVGPAESSAQILEAMVPVQGPLAWADGANACLLEIWKMKRGDLATVDRTVERLRDGSDDPDPAHGRNAFCALALETIATHERSPEQSGELVEDLTNILGQGISINHWFKFELARILEERGDPATAAKILRYVPGAPAIFPLGMSTILRESARLNHLAGNLGEALKDYRSFQRIRPNPDSRFDAMSESIDQRIAELEATLQN